ncbi:hypothetical protein niasHT_017732 [Heterodera trifolii]|uniref:Uncharacterized protein n=1 Tax=Heterodera trifolii TaxID=157864 RepID=A0ABD2L772_9BILA
MQTLVKRSFSSPDGHQNQSPEWFNEISHRFENSYDRHAKAYVKKLLNEVHVNNEKNRIKDKKRIPALEGELIDLKKELKMTKQMMACRERTQIDEASAGQCGGFGFRFWCFYGVSRPAHWRRAFQAVKNSGHKRRIPWHVTKNEQQME